jgi:cation-transporting ATPase E
MADRKKVADKGNGKVSGAMSDGEKVAKNKNATSTEITDTDGGKQNIAEKNINENKESETLDSALGDETVVTNEDGTTVRISKIKTESGKVIIKKTIVRKVVKPKTEDESKVAASNTEISNKEEVKDKAEIKTDKKEEKSGRGENPAVKVVDAQIEESEDKSGADNEKDSSADSKKKEKKAKEKKERNKKSKESAEENDDSKEESEDKKVADEKEEDFALIEKQKKKLEAQQKKQEEAEAKKAFKEKIKMLKETPFVNVEAGADDGLNDEQVEERELRGMTNKVDNSISKSYLKIFTTNIFTLFNLLNIFLACLIIIFNGQIKNMLFAGIAMINLVIGIIQEIRSKRALDKLSLVSAPSIEAVRNGQVVEISTDDIVIDDIIILKQGSQIPTDCIVVGGECEANESLLTGEQDDIHKGIGDQLMSGSFVQSGKCRARVMAVGEDTYASKLMSEAKKFKKSKSELMRSINWIIRIATIIIFPLGILMFITNMKHATSISGAVTSTVSSVIGMIPEGLVMLTSVALALGIVRLAKKRTLVQDLYSIEALARVDVLCLDKTGTITEGSMQVESVHVYSSKFGSPDDIMANLVNALGKNNATFEACAEYFSSNETYKVSKLMPFSSARKWSGASFSGVGTFIVGAPEFVLKERYSLVERNVNEYAMEGYRVLVLVTTPESLQDGAMDPAKMELVALIVLSDKIRSTASATFEYFEQQGVQLKVISGDNPLTVSKVAERAGMKNAEKYIDASVDLDTPDKIYEAAEKYTVFGRVSPSQKKELVAALKAHGHTVGMTGDGVNDVMALKESDCSIAMASGSDASRNVAQLVLLDSDFSSLPSVVSEGRRVINNIERASSLFLVKTTFSAVLSLLLIIFQFSTYPFEPIQLTLINALFVGVPSFILALEPNDRRVKGNFLSKVFKRALPAGLTVAFAIILVCWMYNDIGFDVSPQISTMSVFITASVSFVVLVQVCMPYTKDKIFMLALLLVAFIFAVSNSFLSEKFSLVSLNSDMVLRLVIIIACILPIMAFMRVEIEAFKALFKETGGFIKREKDKAKNFFNRFDNKK